MGTRSLSLPRVMGRRDRGMETFEEMKGAGVDRVLFLADSDSGLRAMLVIDSLALGPATGGIRCRAYPSFHHALSDARRLASAMTLKCAIAGLDAGGAKTVILDHRGLSRADAFRRLGGFIEDLRGLYWTAGDLGTTQADLEAAAEATRYVNMGGARLGEATGRTVVNGIRACVRARGGRDLTGISVAVQGCGLIGGGVARALAAEGAALIVSDVSRARAEAVAAETGAAILEPDQLLSAPVDIVSPCALGGVVTREAVETMRAWAICGGANNQLSEAGDIGRALAQAGILYVPDFLASSGAVITGIAGPVMNREPEPFLDATFETAEAVLCESARFRIPTAQVAEKMARARIAGPRSSH